MSTSAIQNTNDKKIRLLEYLSRLATLRSKITRDIDGYEKILWLSNIPKERGCFTQAWGNDEEHDVDEWIEVEYKREPALPTVPQQCKDWVDQTSLKSKEGTPCLLREITRETKNPEWHEGSEKPETIIRTELLVNNSDIKVAWNRYIEEKWRPWTKLHHTWENNQKAYAPLFYIHQEQLRLGEEYELILGLGLLTWQTPTGQHVRRHLIVADANLEFEARLGKFTVRPHTEGSKLRPEFDMLAIDEQPARVEEMSRNTLSQAYDNPWEKGIIDEVLQGMVHSINSQGEYDDSLAASGIPASSKPAVSYAPALILRKRSAKGLTETLKRIKEQIENGGDVPKEFLDLAEIHREDDWEQNNNLTDASKIKFDGEVFFPKPSNSEQRRIVDAISTANGVLVQGPPGTGKSHTIANLICHLLATGKRTLITAKTPRALKVLEGLLPDELRSLCINLLGSGLEERHSLETSVGGILRKHEEWREEAADRECALLEGTIGKFRKEKIVLDRRIRAIRESETHSQSVAEGTYRGTAARIAEAVNRDRSAYEWFLDSISFEKPCPVSTSDLRDILMTLRQFSPEKRDELCRDLPEAFMPAEDFSELIKNEKIAIEEEEALTKISDEECIDVLLNSPSSAINAVLDTFSVFRDTEKQLAAIPYPWAIEAMHDVLSGNSLLWKELFRATQHAIVSIKEYVAVADETTLNYPNTCDIRTLYEDAINLKEHMKNGGTLGWLFFRPKRVKERIHLIKTVKVNGHFCSTAEDLTMLVDVLHVNIECNKIQKFWGRRHNIEEESFVLQLSNLKTLEDALGKILTLEGIIEKCNEAIQKCSGLKEPLWTDKFQIKKIYSSCRLALSRNNRQTASEKIQNIEKPVSSSAVMVDAHPVVNSLLSAISTRDIELYSKTVIHIQSLIKEKKIFRKFEEQLKELRHTLPILADSLTSTYSESYWDDRVEKNNDAWHWAQARYWIEDYIRQEDIPALTKRSKQIEDNINKTIARLASLHAWSFCFSRLKEKHRRHMEAWQQSMRRLGKGTGKHAPRHRREAQAHLNECREAVPAWVMPLHRVWDTVEPAPGLFDVIIIDEASQCGIEALPLFYLGKKVVIVGDDKQISPDAVGVSRDAVNRLMEEYLYDFDFKNSFDVESSLFDHGRLRYGDRRITLREHFRCMPEIIQFSNDLCYADTPLIPLRQYGPNRVPPLEHVFVEGGYREGSASKIINRPEAEAIVKAITSLCKNSRYDNMSIGVVVLQGEAQAELIESLLLVELGAEEMIRRRLICGNPYSFQGDERDVIFLSLVAAANERIGALSKASDERRFNVAASRARDRMILFHSVTCDDLSSICLRRRLLEFFETEKSQQIAGIERNILERRAAQDNRRLVHPPEPFDSWFEVDVALVLLRKNYNVLAQYDVAGKRIDLVVEGGQARLAVECDGDHWHGVDQYESDMHRQRQLERCGWEFFRVRESAFYTNKADALSGLWDALEDRGIRPS